MSWVQDNRGAGNRRRNVRRADSTTDPPRPLCRRVCRSQARPVRLYSERWSPCVLRASQPRRLLVAGATATGGLIALVVKKLPAKTGATPGRSKG